MLTELIKYLKETEIACCINGNGYQKYETIEKYFSGKNSEHSIQKITPEEFLDINLFFKNQIRFKKYYEKENLLDDSNRKQKCILIQHDPKHFIELSNVSDKKYLIYIINMMGDNDKIVSNSEDTFSVNFQFKF